MPIDDELVGFSDRFINDFDADPGTLRLHFLNHLFAIAVSVLLPMLAVRIAYAIRCGVVGRNHNPIHSKS